MVEVRALHPFVAAEIDVDLRTATSPAVIDEIVAAMHRYPVGVFRNDAPLSDAEHVAFTRRLGPVEPIPPPPGRTPRLPLPEITDQSNLDENGEILADDDIRMRSKRANRHWHTDSAFQRNRSTYSLLSAHVVPPNAAGPTQFADMRAAYDALSDAMKAQLDGVIAVHDYYQIGGIVGATDAPTPDERAAWPPAHHPLVHVHPGSGRKSLYLTAIISEIAGWPEDRGRALVHDLVAHATQPEFVYAHVWRHGDLVMWDNLCTMHRAMPFEDRRLRRDMRRTTVREFAIGHAPD